MQLKASLIVLLAIQIIHGGFGATFDPTVYEQKTELSETRSVMLYWTVRGESISMAITAPSTGWLGVGFSPNGDMVGSDIILGFIAEDASESVSDRHARAHVAPDKDTTDSLDSRAVGVTTIGGNELMFVSFSRALDTCDPQDLAIKAGTTRIIWAFSNTKPANVQSSVAYHSTARGGKSVQLLGNSVVPPLPSDAEQLELLMGTKHTATNADTSYYCQAFKLPERSTKQHIVRGIPKITPGNEALVHHILLFECNDLTDEELAFRGRCYIDNMPSALSNCQDKVIIGWAVGGSGTFFPEEAGFPFGGPSDAKYVMMEVHYDNPTRQPFTDVSGITLTFTPTLRRFDAGVLSIGRHVDPVSMAIPAGQTGYTLEGWCPQQCTQRWEQSELNVVNTVLHSHLAGRGMSLRHIRNGKELRPLAYDAHYDFNFQEGLPAATNTTIRPGDSLLLQCQYDTTDRDSLTFAGLTTQEEMCLAYVLYWPRMNPKHEYCQSETFNRYRGSPSHSCEDYIDADCGDRSLMLDRSLRNFVPYEVNQCSRTQRPGELPSGVSPPQCTAPPAHWPTSHVLRSCSGAICKHQLQACVGNAECTAAAQCMATNNCPMNSTQAQCATCNLTHVEPLASCVASQCLGYIDRCTHCSSCLPCHVPNLCGGKTDGACAACASSRCTSCTDQCLLSDDAVEDRLRACATKSCGLQALVCINQNDCALALNAAVGCMVGGGDFVTCYNSTTPSPTQVSTRQAFDSILRCGATRGCFPLSSMEMSQIPEIIRVLPSPSPSPGASASPSTSASGGGSGKPYGGGTGGAMAGASVSLMTVMAALLAAVHVYAR